MRWNVRGLFKTAETRKNAIGEALQHVSARSRIMILVALRRGWGLIIRRSQVRVLQGPFSTMNLPMQGLRRYL